MKNIELSIIIPCRNGSRWIPLICQSIFDSDIVSHVYEIILVNDCSEDDSLQVMQEIAKGHNPVRVINLGQHLFLGGGRNEGLRQAKGEYIWFVDVDDLVESTGVAAMLEYAKSNKLDVLGFEYHQIAYSGEYSKSVRVFAKYDSVLNGVEFAKTAFYGGISLHLGYVWRFIYRRDYLLSRNLFFAEGVCWEDTVFMPAAIIKASRVGAFNCCLYKYRQNSNSISGTMHRIYPAQLIWEFAFVAGLELLDFARTIADRKLKDELYNTAVNRYINGFYLFLLRTSIEERMLFYQMVSNNNAMVYNLRPVMNKRTVLLLTPFIGHTCVELLSCGYKVYLFLKNTLSACQAN